jgi:hypothetical protein
MTSIAESKKFELPRNDSDTMLRLPYETDKLDDAMHSTDHNVVSSISDRSSTEHVETVVEPKTNEISGFVDIEDLLSDECDELSESDEIDCGSNAKYRNNPGTPCADGYFDIDLNEDFDTNLTLIENHYGNKDSCHREGCSHDDSLECDSGSENSKTESQQDLTID